MTFFFFCVAEALLCGALLYTVVMLLRNHLVYKWRIRALNADLEAYLRGPSYDHMLHDWQCWRFEDFYPEIKE